MNKTNGQIQDELEQNQECEIVLLNSKWNQHFLDGYEDTLLIQNWEDKLTSNPSQYACVKVKTIRDLLKLILPFPGITNMDYWHCSLKTGLSVLPKAVIAGSTLRLEKMDIGADNQYRTTGSIKV